MARIFVYDDREFPDPDPQMSVDQVKATLSDFYGEIANASVKETKRGRRRHLRVPAAGGHQGRLPQRSELKEGARWTTGHLPVCWRQRRRRTSSILELTAELTRPDGAFDLDAAAARQHEVELACVQAQDYAAATGRLAGGAAMAAAAPAQLSGLAGPAPAASAVAAGSGHPSRLRRRLRLVRGAGAPPLSPGGGGGAGGPRHTHEGGALRQSLRGAPLPPLRPVLRVLDGWTRGNEPPWTWLRRGIPFELMGFGYDALHEMWDGYREGLSALVLLVKPPDSSLRWQTRRAPGGVAGVSRRTASRKRPCSAFPEGGIPLDALAEALKGTGFEGAATGLRLGLRRDRQLLPGRTATTTGCTRGSPTPGRTR